MSTNAFLDGRKTSIISARRGLTLLTPPGAEPLTLPQAKLHLRADYTYDDDYITGLIGVAREQVEKYTRRALYRQKMRITLAGFPTTGPLLDDLSIFRPLAGYTSAFMLARPPYYPNPVIKYYDEKNVQQVLDPTKYLMVDEEYGIIEPVFGQVWPITFFRRDAVQVEYFCGYTDGTDANDGAGSAVAGDPKNLIPASIKHAMKLMLSHFYENREPVVTGATAVTLPYGFEDLLGSERAVEWGA